MEHTKGYHIIPMPLKQGQQPELSFRSNHKQTLENILFHKSFTKPITGNTDLCTISLFILVNLPSKSQPTTQKPTQIEHGRKIERKTKPGGNER